jgi:hypothetical protein
VAATHDYLSWNRARWLALRHLTEENGVPPREIDGGFEFNGLYAYDPEYRRRPPKSFWWVQDDKYVLSFGPLPGYEVAERYPYESWLPLRTGTIFVLRRLDSRSFRERGDREWLSLRDPDLATGPSRRHVPLYGTGRRRYL